MLVAWSGAVHNCNDKFSNRVFTNRLVKDHYKLPNNIIIYGSSFYHEKPDTKTFDDTLRGVTFINCNLDNIKVPMGNVLIDCSTKRFMAMDDGFDWEVDKDNKPIRKLQIYIDKSTRNLSWWGKFKHWVSNLWQ